MREERQSRLRLSLRDLLWLTLLLAAVIAAVHTHLRDASEWRQLRDWYSRTGRLDRIHVKSDNDAAQRRQSLRAHSNEELHERLPDYTSSLPQANGTYEYALSELARRRCTKILEQFCQYLERLQADGSQSLYYPRYLIPARIAQRRSAGQSDPLRIRLRRDEDTAAPCLRISLENESGEVEPVSIYRHPRNGHAGRYDQ